MRGMAKIAIVLSVLLVCGHAGYGQTASAAPPTPATAVSSESSVPKPQTAEPAKVPAAAEPPKTDKRKALAEEAARLLTMATDLKVQVDKTNRNILSLTVVQKAEEIEQFAHRMKAEATR